MSQLSNDDVVRYLANIGVASSSGLLSQKSVTAAKTAAYTVLPTDTPGTIFTNAGATGSVTFTLPAPSAKLNGVWFYFLGIADQNIVVAAATADTLVSKNDVAADSVAMSTSAQKIGGLVGVVCVYTGSAYQWVAVGLAVGHTFTVAT